MRFDRSLLRAGEFEDHYEEALTELINAKRKGKSYRSQATTAR